jgi:lipoprotein-anchoring transpeptidase ErfK/SrfK
MRGVVALAFVVLAALIGSAAAQAACGGVSPTSARAWRAFVPGGAPLRARPAGRTIGVLPYAEWLLVLRGGEGRGRCFVELRTAARPSTAHRWVASARVTLHPTSWRIEVSRARRTLTVRHRGRRVARWRVVVGKPSTPTPAGVFAIQHAYRTPASSFVGAWELTLTAHSGVLTTFAGGDGRTALHGRGGASLADPLGTARSHGCIRLSNRAISTIVALIGRPQLAGVPVVVR